MGKTFRPIILLAMLLTTQLLFSQNVVTVTDCNLNGWVKQLPANTPLTVDFTGRNLSDGPYLFQNGSFKCKQIFFTIKETNDRYPLTPQ